ncbi:LGFP repeat-containing protein [Demequina sp. NBRC 110052]|uniref:LGFP repeat-containing protein n=1 Tax=Demequina sp. NBRC 110052 TaxID=1570341 RepID=UPI0009FE5647|nr:hypothetical protein [Demequina sp. NBRC 110052]
MSMTIRRVLAAVLTAAVTLTGALAMQFAQAAQAQAVTTAGFDPGMIMSDSVFYDSNAMTASEIQTFLNKKVPTCHPEWDNNPSDIVCIKDYVTSTVAKNTVMTSGGTVLCTAVDARSGVTAAQVIDIVARACGVSQKVLIVLLQKEQGLITHQWPSSYRYDKATGYACPDTAPCDAQYFGLFNQLYNAALQFKRYKAYPTSYGYRAGQTNFIAYHPYTYSTGACSRASVYIQNQATAGLYNYTPYVPNQAALNAGYGTGDTCSSYGNRNFYLYFTDWFGSTRGIDVGVHVLEYYNAIGGATKTGVQTAAEVALAGGWYQEFTNGTIYVSVNGETAYMRKGYAFSNAYAAAGGPGGSWGWPLGSEFSITGGSQQEFQHVIATWTSATGVTTKPSDTGEGVGAHVLETYFAIGGKYRTGAPSGDEVALDGGWYQVFANGTIYVTANGETAYMRKGYAFSNAYAAAGGPAGSWGWPLGSEFSITGGSQQEFQKVTANWTSATGVTTKPSDTAEGVGEHVVDTYYLIGGKNRVGAPAGDEVALDGGWYQVFANGTIYVTAEGETAYMRKGYAFAIAYAAAGGPAGAWGWPLGSEFSITGGSRQEFQKVTATWTSAKGVTVTVRDTAEGVGSHIVDAYTAAGGSATTGAPTATEVAIGGGWYQVFANGTIYVTVEGEKTYMRKGYAFAIAYAAAGGPAGSWGWPLGNEYGITGGSQQKFQNVTATWTSANGVTTQSTAPDPVYTVKYGILSAYNARGGEAVIGKPIGPETAISGGWYQQFEKGTIYWTTSGVGSYLRKGYAFAGAYAAAGGPTGSWGFPLGDEFRVDSSTTRQNFQKVVATWTNATGVTVKAR